ncbi:MAG: MFS transporter [Alphaproteobacteria bacterium]|nr:MFS transporter [Alphaproteobacteria bacterium]
MQPTKAAKTGPSLFLRLMAARRFAPLFWCQFLSAFNDNFVRNMLAMILLFRMDEKSAGPLITLAVGLFILPSLFLSALGGEMADALDKAMLARRLKGAEILVQALAASAIALDSLPLLYLALFALGVIAALFGPIKYGLLPDHLALDELTTGNALIEAATFVAIVLGLIIGAQAYAHMREPWTIGAQMMAIALACWLTSRSIPPAPSAAPDLRIRANIWASTRDLLAQLRKDHAIWAGALAVSWFWMTGALALSLVPVMIKHRLGAGLDVETLVSALFAIGIGLGSLLAAVIAGGRILLLQIPLAGLAMAACLIDLGATSLTLSPSDQELTLAGLITSPVALRLAFDICLLAIAGGLFVVPAFAAVQAWSQESRRARNVAGVNILTSLFIVGGTLVAASLQGPVLDPTESSLLIGLGLLNLLAAAYFYKILPKTFTRRSDAA